MLARDFGSTGVEIPVIGQGTWQIRTGKSGLEALRAGIELGMTHIDTAEMYTDAEEVVAKAIRGIREKIFLVSKVVPSNASYKGTLRACDASLKRLNKRLPGSILHVAVHDQCSLLECLNQQAV